MVVEFIVPEKIDVVPTNEPVKVRVVALIELNVTPPLMDNVPPLRTPVTVTLLPVASPMVGVLKIGFVNIAEFAFTTAPVPVDVVDPVPPLVTGNGLDNEALVANNGPTVNVLINYRTYFIVKYNIH
jgi:hypothetical protein